MADSLGRQHGISRSYSFVPLHPDAQQILKTNQGKPGFSTLCLLLSGKSPQSLSEIQTGQIIQTFETVSKISSKSPKMKTTSIAKLLCGNQIESTENVAKVRVTPLITTPVSKPVAQQRSSSLQHPICSSCLNVQTQPSINPRKLPIVKPGESQAKEFMTINLKELDLPTRTGTRKIDINNTNCQNSNQTKISTSTPQIRVTTVYPTRPSCTPRLNTEKSSEVVLIPLLPSIDPQVTVKRPLHVDIPYRSRKKFKYNEDVVEVEVRPPRNAEEIEEVSWSTEQIDDSDTSSSIDESEIPDYLNNIVHPKTSFLSATTSYNTGLWRQYRDKTFYLANENKSMWKDPKQVCPATKEDLELANALGIPSEALQSDHIAERKLSIQKTVASLHYRSDNSSPFALFEEFDVHCRAEAYASSVVPDPDYYIVCGTMPLMALERRQAIHIPGKNKRRKKTMATMTPTLDNMASMVHYDDTPFYTYCVTPGDGTQLLKPIAKLVELVAQALNDSPDGMLQVQQVYTILQKKYPYFQHFDKSTLTSWKSSIRHALYQKWFQKVYFGTDFISIRGCYWSINRGQTPKDWHMPLPADHYLLPDFDSVFDDNWFNSMDSLLNPNQVNDFDVLDPVSPSPCVSPLPVITSKFKDDFILSDLDTGISGSEGSGYELKGDPDPILNNLNFLTQSTECDDRVFNLDEESQFNSESEENWSPDLGNSDELHTANLSSLGLLPALTTEGGQDLDLYVPLSSELPFYIAFPSDESVEIFNRS